MDISKLDKLINKINTNPDVVTNDVIKTIRTCSAENLMESFRKNDNITGMTLLFLCYENSEIYNCNYILSCRNWFLPEKRQGLRCELF